MLAIEQAHGQPIDKLLVALVNRTGSLAGAAAELGIPTSTARLWCWRLGILLSTRRSVTAAMTLRERARQERARSA